MEGLKRPNELKLLLCCHITLLLLQLFIYFFYDTRHHVRGGSEWEAPSWDWKHLWLRKWLIKNKSVRIQYLTWINISQGKRFITSAEVFILELQRGFSQWRLVFILHFLFINGFHIIKKQNSHTHYHYYRYHYKINYPKQTNLKYFNPINRY